MASLSEQLSEQEFTEFMDVLDPDGSGSFNFDSFLKLMGKMLKESMNENDVNAAFQVCRLASTFDRVCSLHFVFALFCVYYVFGNWIVCRCCV